MFLTDLGFEFHYMHISACQNINNLIDAVKKNNDEEEVKFKYIILIDEVEIYFEHSYDLTYLKWYFEDIDVLIAINPTSQTCKSEFGIKFPEPDSTSITKRLRHKHRSCTEICVFNLHHKKFSNDHRQKTINVNEDAGLGESTYATGRNPLLILTAKDVSDEVLIETIENYLLPHQKHDVFLIHGQNFKGQRNQNISRLCQEKGRSWTLIRSNQMTGSEASVIVLLHLDDNDTDSTFEYHTRAKHLLIIIQE